MRPLVFIVAATVFVAGGTITYLILHALSFGNTELTFVVGAIVGTQAAALAHHRTPDAENTITVRLAIGVVLAVSAIAFGLVLHAFVQPFGFVEISLPIAAIGSFVFPLILFGTMWSALAKKPDA